MESRAHSKYVRAENGNVLQAAKLPLRETTTHRAGIWPRRNWVATETANKSLQRDFCNPEYVAGWKEYAGSLKHVNPSYEKMFQLSAMVLKAHEDKTFRGAMIASMSLPWGFAVNASEPNAGGYHLVWARDLYEIATGLLAAGDRAAAERALNYLLTVQQKPDGSFPQNSWLDGKAYWTALQLDENSYPLVLAWQLGRTDPDTWTKHLRPEAEFVIAHGPITEQERWEELNGYCLRLSQWKSPSLVCGPPTSPGRTTRTMTPIVISE